MVAVVIFNKLLCSLSAFPRILYIMCIISHTQHEDRKANRKSEGW